MNVFKTLINIYINLAVVLFAFCRFQKGFWHRKRNVCLCRHASESSCERKQRRTKVEANTCWWCWLFKYGILTCKCFYASDYTEMRTHAATFCHLHNCRNMSQLALYQWSAINQDIIFTLQKIILLTVKYIDNL